MSDAIIRSSVEFPALIEDALESLLREGLLQGSEMSRAVHYAMFSGGKRTRPLLTLLAAQTCGGDVRKALRAACAIECLHGASLILDDLPCMDNASERRGISSAHLIFGEGIATLAALALLNQAYSLFGEHPRLAAEAGLCVAEMIDGQSIDLQGGRERAHRKTTGLLRLSLTAGAIACGICESDVLKLARCGEYLGEAYQIYDDFEDGDRSCRSGADELVAEAKSLLQDHFGQRILPLLTAIDGIVTHFRGRQVDRRLVAA